MSSGTSAPPKYQAPGTAAPAPVDPFAGDPRATVLRSGGMAKNVGGPQPVPEQFQDAANQMGPPIDWSQFAGMSATGDQARQQAIDAAYGQATSRLDPMWGQREDAERTRLLNQGLPEDSEAFKNSMGEFGRQRNDAYSQALSSAIGQGTQAGDTVFRQGMMTRQQALAEALRRRGMPLDELAKWQDLYGDQGKLDAANSPWNTAKDIMSVAGDFIPGF